MGSKTDPGSQKLRSGKRTSCGSSKAVVWAWRPTFDAVRRVELSPRNCVGSRGIGSGRTAARGGRGRCHRPCAAVVLVERTHDQGIEKHERPQAFDESTQYRGRSTRSL